jgi:hypothetical protein
MLRVKDKLAKQQYVCITADIWSLPKKSYMGATCHWIDTENLSRRSVALACGRLKGAHTHERIDEMLYDINAEFGLRNASATFSRLVTKLLSGSKDFAAGYENDILIFSS